MKRKIKKKKKKKKIWNANFVLAYNLIYNPAKFKKKIPNSSRAYAQGYPKFSPRSSAKMGRPYVKPMSGHQNIFNSNLICQRW